jgi:hypothetical protein
MVVCDYRGVFMWGLMLGGLLAAWIAALWDVFMGETKKI